MATPLGGNKVRALEFLLGDVRPGDVVVTVGGVGSTHALATAVYASRLGARAAVYRWPQEMNDSARLVDARLGHLAAVHDASWIGAAYVRVALRRLTARVRWIPAGGTSPLGILGHVDAALELAEQIAAGVMPLPAQVVVPLGSGGTAAGLLLGFAVANLPIEVVGVQVVPRVMANARRVHGLAAATTRLIERVTGRRLRTLRPGTLAVERAYYGGAYGRPTEQGLAAALRFREAHAGAMLDATYSAKACAAALARGTGRGATLFWNTFDSRLLVGGERWDVGDDR